MISVCWTLEHFYSILTIVWLSYPTLPFFFFLSNLYFILFFSTLPFTDTGKLLWTQSHVLTVQQWS